MLIYARNVSLFDKDRFARCFAAFLAENGLKGSHFSELSGIPQYQVSRILSGKRATFGDDHSQICQFMQIRADGFFFGDENGLATAIDNFCRVGMPRARYLARIVADVAALPNTEP